MGGVSHKVGFGRLEPKHARLADLGTRASSAVMYRLFARCGVHRLDSKAGRSQQAALEQAIHAGREAYVLGIGTGLHNAGIALVRVSKHGTVELVCNEEEERYTGVKHCTAFPENSIASAIGQMDALGLSPSDLTACVSTWEFVSAFVTLMGRPVLEEMPASLSLMRQERPSEIASGSGADLMRTATRLADRLGLDEKLSVIGMRHHDNHAYFSYGVSPFASDASSEPTIVLVTDGSGDDASTSFYEARSGRLELLRAYGTNVFGSLGTAYGVLSSTLGGWPMLSSEGRYMGAAAWGDGNRLTNRYYRRLKHLFHFGAEGEIRLNRALANWTQSGWEKPYSDELIDILGKPIPISEMWHPDAVLNVEDIRHPEITRERVDKAAAVQMVFEDALAHMVDHLIRTTGSHRLVLTGGTALNCVANMRLLECFDEAWYERNLGAKGKRLHLWVPPTPGDAGAPIGAAYAFAMRAGARPGKPLRHAFYCGVAPTGASVRAAITAEPTANSMELGDCSDPEVRQRVADLLASLISKNGIVGLYQGNSETGPRALGHRSILANPCNPDTRRLLNERVKHRELIRPLAPMLTRAAAERFFHLEDGASDDDFNAYNYMVLTARARPEANEAIPSVIHHDGTGRLQIVRPATDAFCYDFLLAMGRRIGVEASVNTSLNVGAPIAHTPTQAVETLSVPVGWMVCC